MTHRDEISSKICVSYSQAIMLYTQDQEEEAHKEVTHLTAMIHRWKNTETEINPSGWVVDSMDCALRAIREAGGDTRKVIVTAVNYGGDADPIGAIAGGLVGAQNGVDDIPSEWLAELPADICRRIEAFAAFCAGV